MNHRLIVILVVTMLSTACTGEGQPAQEVTPAIDFREQANLTIEISVPQKSVSIIEAKLTCFDPSENSEDADQDSDSKNALFPSSWCDQTAGNLPLKTNEDGLATLFFALDPPPSSSVMRLTDGPLYTNPYLYLNLGGVEHLMRPTALAFNKWKLKIVR